MVRRSDGGRATRIARLVLQAMHCLTTEAMNDMPQAVSEALSGRDLDDELAEWVTELLLVGRAFQIALTNGRLDDL